MRIHPLVLLWLLAASPAFAQVAAPPSLLGQAAHPAPAKPKPAAAKPARHVPVVRAPHNTHAVKAKPRTPAATPSVPPANAVPAVPAPSTPTTAAPPPAADTPAAPPPPDPNKGSVTGLPIPRFMSLRFDDVNLRVGPGTRYPIDWVYHRRDLPVEILRELEDWRLVQDQDNVRGWVRAPALSPRRSVAVRDADQTLRAKPDDNADAVAILKPGVIARLRACAAGAAWCEVEASTYRGWLKRSAIYGLYPNEAIGG